MLSKDERKEKILRLQAVGDWGRLVILSLHSIDDT